MKWSRDLSSLFGVRFAEPLGFSILLPFVNQSVPSFEMDSGQS